MPTQPTIESLPPWAQITISILVGLATLFFAIKGYLKPSSAKNSDQQTTAILAASIADMGAIRRLAECVASLDGHVIALTTTVNEATHYARNGVDTEREICQRLRELTEELERCRDEARFHGK